MVDGKDHFILPKGLLKENTGYCWEIALPDVFAEGDTTQNPNGSNLVLTEDGKVLGSPHSQHSEIKATGNGRFSYWGRTLYFSSSDNSDPTTNGRLYDVYISETRIPPFMPNTVHFNLTNACNLNCRICRPEDFQYTPVHLDNSSVDKVIEEGFDHIKNLRIDSSGENMLSPHYSKVIMEATKKKIPIFICTNGTMLTQERVELLCASSVNQIQISFDSPEKETLEWIRSGAKYEQILAGVRRLVATKEKTGRKDLNIHFHAAVMQCNMDHMLDLLKLAADIGLTGVSTAHGFIHDHMDINLSIFWDRAKFNSTMNECTKLASKLGLQFNHPKLFSHADNSKKVSDNTICPYLYSTLYIQPSGEINPCCIAPVSMGNLNEQSFHEIWHGEIYQKMRETHNTDNPYYYKCSCCYLLEEWDADDFHFHFGQKHWPQVEELLNRGERANHDI